MKRFFTYLISFGLGAFSVCLFNIFFSTHSKVSYNDDYQINSVFTYNIDGFNTLMTDFYYKDNLKSWKSISFFKDKLIKRIMYDPNGIKRECRNFKTLKITYYDNLGKQIEEVNLKDTCRKYKKRYNKKNPLCD